MDPKNAKKSVMDVWHQRHFDALVFLVMNGEVDPSLPTHHKPGSIWKNALLAVRYWKGLPLWVDGDNNEPASQEEMVPLGSYWHEGARHGYGEENTKGCNHSRRMIEGPVPRRKYEKPPSR